jgi:hypothetical protein
MTEDHDSPEEQQTHIAIAGETYERVRYGREDEDWGADRRPCHDCGVTKGELHIWGCDVERCPACDGQLISVDVTTSRSRLIEIGRINDQAI